MAMAATQTGTLTPVISAGDGKLPQPCAGLGTWYVKIRNIILFIMLLFLHSAQFLLDEPDLSAFMVQLTGMSSTEMIFKITQ